jgi:hypothetical protein
VTALLLGGHLTGVLAPVGLLLGGFGHRGGSPVALIVVVLFLVRMFMRTRGGRGWGRRGGRGGRGGWGGPGSWR